MHIPARLPKLPECRDLNDQMFIELAAVGEADWLVTGDKDLLDVRGNWGQISRTVRIAKL